MAHNLANILCQPGSGLSGHKASATVVEGIGLHVEDILVSLVLSMIIIISCTFRPMRKTNTVMFTIGNQYSYFYKMLGHFFV